MLYFNIIYIYPVIYIGIIILILIFSTPLRLGLSLAFDYHMRIKMTKE